MFLVARTFFRALLLENYLHLESANVRGHPCIFSHQIKTINYQRILFIPS